MIYLSSTFIVEERWKACVTDMQESESRNNKYVCLRGEKRQSHRCLALMKNPMNDLKECRVGKKTEPSPPCTSSESFNEQKLESNEELKC